jgi:hypothetical protein
MRVWEFSCIYVNDAGIVGTTRETKNAPFEENCWVATVEGPEKNVN